MRFLIDAQLPPALASWLAARGHVAEHVADHGLEGAPDAAIWDRAVVLGAAIVTKDVDFARRRVFDTTGPVIVWVRLPNTRRDAPLVWFETALPLIAAAARRGETLIELV